MNDYGLLRDYLKKQKLPEFVLGFEQIEEIIDAALPRAAQRASWWETLRSPQEKMPQREACLEAGYIATRQADGKSVKFKRMPQRRPRKAGTHPRGIVVAKELTPSLHGQARRMGPCVRACEGMALSGG